jgi:uncharacterized protein YndB with AHSA1/START domain
VEKFEFERGGHWRFVELAPEGAQGFEGRYREIIPNERIVWTFEWDGLPGQPLVETTTFEDAGPGRTRVVSLSQFFTDEERDGMFTAMQPGVEESYAALDRLLAGMR